MPQCEVLWGLGREKLDPGERHSGAQRSREQDGEAKRAKLSPPSKQVLFLGLYKLLFKPHRNITLPLLPGQKGKPKRLRQTSLLLTALISNFKWVSPSKAATHQSEGASLRRARGKRRTKPGERNTNNIWLKTGNQLHPKGMKERAGLRTRHRNEKADRIK